jgi:hypothetical protein
MFQHRPPATRIVLVTINKTLTCGIQVSSINSKILEIGFHWRTIETRLTNGSGSYVILVKVKI